MVLEYLYKRSNDPNDEYTLYITENEMPRNDLVLGAAKGYGILIEYIYPIPNESFWKTIFIKNERLASIFCDYIENHIPINHAIERDKDNSYLKDLIKKLQ